MGAAGREESTLGGRGYCLLIGAFAVGIGRWRRSFGKEVASKAAGLLARQKWRCGTSCSASIAPRPKHSPGPFPPPDHREGVGLRQALTELGTPLAPQARGIPSDILARIYERGFTAKGTGSGIGLHVARTLVEMHVGEIRTESHEGRGTLVEVALPILLRS